ncbi:MAG: redox-active disulfide protein 2 [Candidatus Moranbacteria bacterium CG23_combo_of_CG06-09_8_20_14_all_35_22]|nr:MAG: redox-active disulfide protein 2 [Candidatus Moranbacteria bacterium CG23_combo_of_CG06-09_8_20_14_all_35_22]
MKIKILGTGCPNCQKLEKNTMQALSDLKLEAKVEKVTDIEKIMSYGVMSLPAIVVDEKVLSYGTVLSAEEIKKLLTDKKEISDSSVGCCSCNGKC